jgi:alpha-1,6-mannosyltransferase
LERALKYRVLAAFAILASAGLYYYQGYVLSRDNFEGFFGSYLLLFGLFYWLWLNRQNFLFNHFLILSLSLRLILLFAVPALSNDFFRFIWDGELITNGINPYAHKPDDLISFGGFLDEDRMRVLYHGMGELSQQSYSCYPPLNQLFFVIPAALSDTITTQLIIFKIIMILADLGIILVAKKIAEHLKININQIWLFALNPFIILEFTGNIHFEGVMIFFMLCAIYLLLKNQWIFSTVFFAFAVQVKLIPLIILPLFWKKLGLRKMIGYVGFSAILIMLLGKLFLNETFLLNMMGSVDQYFERFEFNAGIFYVIREIGFMTVGYDTIQSVMPVLTKIILISIIFMAIMRKYKTDQDILLSAMFAFVIFYGFSTTVHPWYISLVLIYSVFTNYRFALIWSFLVMLSYSAYAETNFAENKWFLMTEYILVGAVLVYEIIKNRKPDLLDLQFKKLLGKDNG